MNRLSLRSGGAPTNPGFRYDLENVARHGLVAIRELNIFLQCSEQFLDRYAFAIVGIDETRRYFTVATGDEGRRDRQQPRIIALKLWKIAAGVEHHPFHFVADPKR